MNERLLQYIWQFQYFSRSNLLTLQNDPLLVIHPGQYNTHQGPDFTAAKIRIADTVWAGHVELHIKTSDWDKHAHTSDPNYKNVILHVVWENDAEIISSLPLVVLKDRVSKLLLEQYENWMQQQYFIPCEKQLSQVHPLIWTGWKERLLVERLQRKTGYVFQLLEQSKYHWEEVFWWMLTRNFGIKVNAESFESIARSVPVTLLAKHKNQLLQIEALLFGQAGLLNCRMKEKYPVMLQREYRFLKKKYSLTRPDAPLHFLRMRPSNFPSVRLAQLAILIQQSSHLFSVIRDINELQQVKTLFNVTANDYWHYHYRFDELSDYQPKQLGEMMTNNIIINTIVPVLFAYGQYHNDPVIKARAMRWMEESTAETNAIISRWQSLGVQVLNAFDSQALLELRSQYCEGKRCLDCAVGNHLLKRKLE